MACVSCGAEEPTHIFEFTEEIGAIYVRILQTRERELCRRCVGRYFRASFFTNLFFGWWGVISFFKNPINLIQNIIEYWRCRDLEIPDAAAMANAAAQGPVSPQDQPSTIWRYATLGGVLLLPAFAYMGMHPDKYFPPPAVPDAATQAGQGESAADTNIDVGQFIKDIQALQEDTASKNWTGMRIQLLSRESYLLRLTLENERLQKLLKRDRDENRGKNDPCAQWGQNKFGPAVRSYVAAMNDIFPLLKSTPQPTAKDKEEFWALLDQRESAVDQLNGALADAKGIKCESE